MLDGFFGIFISPSLFRLSFCGAPLVFLLFVTVSPSGSASVFDLRHLLAHRLLGSFLFVRLFIFGVSTLIPFVRASVSSAFFSVRPLFEISRLLRAQG